MNEDILKGNEKRNTTDGAGKFLLFMKALIQLQSVNATYVAS